MIKITGKVLVTGGAGFIGYHTVRELLEGNYEVVVLDNFSTGSRDNLHPGAKVIEANILDEKISAIMKAEKVDHIVHLAAQTMTPFSINYPDKDASANILGSLKILEAAKNNQIKRFVFASTAAVYGDLDKIPLKENEPTIPTSFYGLSKITTERYLALYHKLFAINYISLRFANVYGERQGDGGEGGVVSIFARKLKNDEPLEVFGDGWQTRDFVYAGDVARAICLSLSAPKANINQVYNVSTKNQISVNDLIRVLAQSAGKNAAVIHKEPRKGDIYHSMLDNSSIAEMLGWRPKVDLAAGLEKTYYDLIRRNEH